eukprot:jgi/Botrbrau1/18641/Bobra.0367s0077.1
MSDIFTRCYLLLLRPLFLKHATYANSLQIPLKPMTGTCIKGSPRGPLGLPLLAELPRGGAPAVSSLKMDTQPQATLRRNKRSHAEAAFYLLIQPRPCRGTPAFPEHLRAQPNAPSPGGGGCAMRPVPCSLTEPGGVRHHRETQSITFNLSPAPLPARDVHLI